MFTTSEFEETSIERELFLRHFRKAKSEKETIKLLTTTDILVFLEKTHSRRLAIRRLGAEIKKLGFVPRSVRVGVDVQKKYELVEVSELESMASISELLKQQI